MLGALVLGYEKQEPESDILEKEESGDAYLSLVQLLWGRGLLFLDSGLMA